MCVVMSLSRKRPLTVEGESGGPKEKKSAATARPPRPTKRRKTADNTETQKNQEPKVTVKGKRQAWSKPAIDAFYEGLVQHGKDFQKILKYMQSKQKRLNDSTIGNLTKDQVRFFYYRNWHKVELLLTSPAQHQQAETKKASNKTSMPQTVETPANPVESAGEVSEVVVEDRHEGETENPLDSSMDELDCIPSPSRAADQDRDEKGSQSPAEKEPTEKAKEQVQASPGSATTDKVEGKVKDTVLVNGVKQSLDLVALICYNKLRKNGLGEHNIGKRLSELVFQGATSIPGKVKGKRKAQIKIPNCGAFRVLPRKPEPASDDHPSETVDSASDNTTDGGPQSDSAATDSARISELKSAVEPEEVVVELRPLTTATWLYVQGLSQNPRVRLKLDMSGSLSTLQNYLSLKWNITGKGCLKFSSSNSNSLSPPPVLTRQTVSLPSTPNTNPVTHTSLSVRDCHSVPATPKPECTLGDLENMHQASVVDDRMDTEAPVCSVVEGRAAEAEKDFSQRFRDTEIEQSSTWRKLYSEFGNSGRLQLSYEFARTKELMSTHPNSLRAAMKLVEFFSRKATSTYALQNPILLTPVKKPAAILHRSPKVVEYMQTLSRRSPQKSPLSKYKRLKAKSPLKHAINHKHAVRRVQLTFENKTIPTSTNEFSTIATQVSVTQGPSTSTIPSTSPTVLNTLKINDKSPHVIQLTTPKRTAVRAAPLGSFSDMKMQALLSNFPEPSSRAKTSTQKQISQSVKAPSVSPTSSGTTSPLYTIKPLHSASSNRSPIMDIPPVSSSQVTTNRTVASKDTNTLVRIQPVVPLRPGVHRIQPRQSVSMVSATVSKPSPCISLTIPNMGVPLMPKAAPQGDKMDGSTFKTVMPIMSTRKPFGKPKRIKKPPAKPGQPHQLVPRPLPFLRDVNFGPSPTVNTPRGPTDTTVKTNQPLPTPEQVTSALNSLDSSNPPRHSSPRKTTAALIQNQHMMLQLLQSYLLQQQQKQLGKSVNSAVNPVSSSQTTTSSTLERPPTIATLLDTAGPSVATRSLNEHETEIPQKELQSTVLDNFFSEQPAHDSSSVSKLFNTSSDTVNNLLRGLSSVKPDKSILKLSEETSDVLPTFAKALGDSLLSPKSHDEGQTVSADTSGEREKDEQVEQDDKEIDSTESDPVDQVPTSTSEDSQLSFLNDISSSFSDILGTLTDSNFRQVADNGEVFEHIDFSDMFSQLKDVLSPEKTRTTDSGGAEPNLKPSGLDDNQSSIGDLLDYVNSPVKSKAAPQAGPSSFNAPVDPVCRSFLEENSVDFIQKFRELASTMDGHSS